MERQGERVENEVLEVLFVFGESLLFDLLEYSLLLLSLLLLLMIPSFRGMVEKMMVSFAILFVLSEAPVKLIASTGNLILPNSFSSLLPLFSLPFISIWHLQFDNRQKVRFCSSSNIFISRWRSERTRKLTLLSLFFLFLFWPSRSLLTIANGKTNFRSTPTAGNASETSKGQSRDGFQRSQILVILFTFSHSLLPLFPNPKRVSSPNSKGWARL